MKQKVLIYGTHAVLGALLYGNRTVYEVLVTNKSSSKIPEKFKNITRLSTDYEISKILEKKGRDINHQGLLAFCSDIITKSLKDVNLEKERSTVIILDSLTDVTNIGNIIRSACAFNVDFLLYHKTNMPDIAKNDIVIKGSSGGIEHLSIIAENNLVNAINTLKKNGYWIIGFEGSSKEDLKTFKQKNGDIKKKAIVVGSEGTGMRDLTTKSCDFLVRINISKNMESLNVASAATIALYELS